MIQKDKNKGYEGRTDEEYEDSYPEKIIIKRRIKI